MVIRRRILLTATSLALAISSPLAAQEIQLDPADPFVSSFSEKFFKESGDDANKSPGDLVFESRMLMLDQRPLDARSKLLLALHKDPKNIDAHLLLAGYYLSDVGHFRLALKYTKQAQNLFTEANGQPPYTDVELQQQHANILYLLAQVRLNLDEYQGALETLDLFSSYGYFSTWYPGTRAWVLMKLGRLDEAIQVARMGTLFGSEPGRTLNMLGILLSMKGEREASLDVLKRATTYELSLGRDGQPATPLNNSGEVYKEMFAEDQAETAWVKATSLPDGCEHVLPSLNLSLLYIDQLNLTAASKTMDSFESCIAQFPLRNGEEHRSLVALIRGRIALHRGQIDKAIEQFQFALNGRQWFGKIGTDQEDLDAGARVSLAQALAAKINRLKLTPSESMSDSAISLYESAGAYLKEWWVARRAQQLLTETLNSLEDLSIRNTDSMLEYPTLGDILAPLPPSVLRRRVNLEEKADSRQGASPYYLSYLAANAVDHGSRSDAVNYIAQALNQIRPQKDVLLELYLYILQLRLTRETAPEYPPLALKAFSSLRTSLRSYGFRLPIRGNNLSSEAASVLYDSGFITVANGNSPYTVSHRIENGEHVLELIAQGGVLGNVTVRGASLVVVGRKLAELVSTIE